MASVFTRAQSPSSAPESRHHDRPSLLPVGLLGRRLFLGIALACMFAGLLPGTSSRASDCSPNEADCFLQTIGANAIELLGDPQIAKADREQRFLALLEKDFNVPRISRFIVGRYWRGASEAERGDFMDVFGKVMARRFAPLFSDIASDQFTVGAARQDSKDANTYFVDTIITAGGKDPVKTTWRIESLEGGFRILDIVVEGVSYAMTLRSEYASVLKRDKGDIGKLVSLLRQRVQ